MRKSCDPLGLAREQHRQVERQGELGQLRRLERQSAPSGTSAQPVDRRPHFQHHGQHGHGQEEQGDKAKRDHRVVEPHAKREGKPAGPTVNRLALEEVGPVAVGLGRERRARENTITAPNPGSSPGWSRPTKTVGSLRQSPAFGKRLPLAPGSSGDALAQAHRDSSDGPARPPPRRAMKALDRGPKDLGAMLVVAEHVELEQAGESSTASPLLAMVAACATASSRLPRDFHRHHGR